MADNLTTFMCRLSRNLGASTSRNPVGLSRPVMGLLYLYLFVCIYNHYFNLHRTNTALYSCLFFIILLYVFEFLPDDGQRTRPKHVVG
jgi:hypothetical protein